VRHFSAIGAPIIPHIRRNPYERPDIDHVTRLENGAALRLRDEAGHAAWTDSRSERMGFRAANRCRQSMTTSPENHGILPDQWFAAADVALRKPKRAKSPVGNH
jgi:hypothetical protein